MTKTVRRSLWLVVGLGTVAVAATAAATVVPWSATVPDLPTVRLGRSTLKLDVFASGEVRAGQVASLAAPSVGATLRLVTLADTGTAVKAGDVVMAFDPSDQAFALEQSRSELLEAEQEIIKMRADTAVQAAQDRVDLLTARFDVRRAEMDAASGEDLISAVEAQKRKLALEEAKRRLAQLEEDVQSRAETKRAALVVVEEKRNKARLATERAQQIIESLEVRAPIDGLVVAKENRDASGGFFFSGMTLPEYRVGDSVGPGRPVLDVFSSGQMEIRVKVNEQERGNVKEGQAATVRTDALPGRTFTARVGALSGLAARSMFESRGPSRQFDVNLKLDTPDSRLRPGSSVEAVISGPDVANVISVPRQALFEKDGKPIVYVRGGERFEAREVKVTHRTESRVAVEGLPEGAEVALVNPETAARASGQKPAGPVVGGPQ
jgi:multidrug resistance efflux pump